MPANLTSVSGEMWFKNTNLILKVLNASKTVDYYLVNRWDREADYQLKLENRQLVSTAKKSLEFGPIIIPVKYRFEREKNKIIAPDEFSADINIGIYGGYRFGKYRVRYQSGEVISEMPAVGISVGGFLNVGASTLDSLTTTIGKIPLKKDAKATIGTFSPGVGVMASISNLQIGFYSGIDFGFGKSAKNWNYNNRLWVGFGVAYNINGFWKK